MTQNSASITLYDGKTIVNLSESDLRRFWSKVDMNNGGCWNWRSGKSKKGYGYFSVKPFNLQSHRVAWAISNPTNPSSGLMVMHKCDNPPCCNPDHLFIGTAQDNSDDMMSKGRHNPPRGERCSQHKLDRESVAKIEEMLLLKTPQTQIAKLFNVNQSTISNIKRRKTWRS